MPVPMMTISYARLIRPLLLAGLFEPFVQRLDEEILPPHDALVDAQPFALMIDAVLEDALPAGRLDGQERGVAQGAQDRLRVAAVLRRALRLLRQLGELEQSARRDGRGGALVGIGWVGLLPVVGRDAVLGCARDIEVGAALRSVEEAPVARETIGGAEAVEGPGLPARPRGIAAPALVRGLAQERARVEVEDALVGRAAIAAHQEAARGQAVLHRGAPQAGVGCLLGGVEDDADVHHDVDEGALRRDEGAQIAPSLVETQRHRLARLDYNGVDGVIACEIVPALPRGPEEEAQVVHAAIRFAVLDE